MTLHAVHGDEDGQGAAAAHLNRIAKLVATRGLSHNAKIRDLAAVL